MATFTDRLMGEVIENPEGQERDVEFLLINLLHSLMKEQQLINIKTISPTGGSLSSAANWAASVSATSEPIPSPATPHETATPEVATEESM